MNTSSSAAPVISARSIISIVNALRPRLVSTLCLVGLGVVTLTAPRIFAAPPPVTVTQPVQVQVVNTAAQPAQVQVVNPVQVQGTVSLTGGQPVDVQGSVETLNDALHQPYLKTDFANVEAGSYSASVSVPVPAGKRLVIETIAVRVGVPVGQTALVSLTATSEGAGVVMPVAMQSSVDWNVSTGHFTKYSSTLPVHLRADGPTNADGALIFEIERNTNVGSGDLRVTIAGYLVDL